MALFKSCKLLVQMVEMVQMALITAFSDFKVVQTRCNRTTLLFLANFPLFSVLCPAGDHQKQNKKKWWNCTPSRTTFESPRTT